MDPTEVLLDDVVVNTNALVLRHIASLDLSGVELRILLWLMSSMNADGTVLATREDIASLFDVGDTYVSKVTTKLKNHGLAWREDHQHIRVNPHFAGRGSHEAWLRTADALPADAPQIMVKSDLLSTTQPQSRPSKPARRKRHLRVVRPT
ncbi:hypothetical protein [Nocardiopsis synnemataformans]|uniref:hypothetical protein n=1 Tax=Nocardiopsis synnemataformans TaxID=61305 RepID=UPI003EC0DE1E